MPVDTAPVVIRIEVTDGNSGAVVAALEKSFQQLGAAGAAAGKQVQTGMAGMSAAAKAAAGIPASAAATPAAISNWSVRQKQSTQEATRAQLDLNAAIEQGVAAGMSFDDTMNAAYAAMAKTNAQATALRTTMASTWREAAGMGAAGAVMPGGTKPSGTGTAVKEAGGADAARDAAAMAAYDAISARSADSAKRLGAAFDAARAQGMGFMEAIGASVAAIEAEDAAAKSATRSTLGMGSAYGETRVMMGGLTGSIGQMESGFARMLASTKALATLMNGLFDVAMIGAGAAMIGVSAQEVYNLYEKWMDVDAAQNKYLEDREKARDEDFTNVQSIEDARERIDEATRSMNTFRNASQAALGTGGMWEEFFQLIANPQQAIMNRALAQGYAGMQVGNEQRLDKLSPKAIEEAHQLNVAQIEFNHSKDAELSRQARITAEMQKQVELAAEKRRYDAQRDQALGNPVAPNAGADAFDLSTATARNEAAAKLFDLQKSQAQELARIHEEALEAGLHGQQRYEAEEAAAIEDLKAKDLDSVKARSDVHAKFHTEEMARLREEELETQRAEREARSSGLTGIGRTQAEGAERIANLNANQELDPAFRARQIAAAQEATNAEILQQERQFADEVNELSDRSAEHQISGFARIRAEAQSQLDQLQRKFQETYGQIDVYAPGGLERYSRGLALLQQGQQAVGSGANRQTSDLSRRNEQETEQIEAQARIRTMSAEKQQTAAIEEEYEERVRKYQDSLNQDLAATEGNLTLQQQLREDFNRRVAAAQEEMNAQLVEQARQAREKIAGELRGLMGAHPLEALQEIGSKMAAQAGAAMLQRAATHYGVNPEMGTQNLFDRMAGMPRGSSGRGGALHGAATSTAIAHAEIHVDQASIYAGGGAGAAGSRGGSTWMMGGGGAGSGSTAIPGGGFSGGGRSGSSSGSGSWEPSWSGGFSPTLSGGSTTAAGSSSGGVGGGSGTSWTGSGITSATPAGTAPKAGLGFTGIARDTLAGAQTTRSIIGMMRSGKSQQGAAGALQPTDANQQYDINGNPVSSGSGGGSAVSTAVGAGADALGLFAAHKQGGMGGTLGGAMSGAQLGMMVGGPVGAAIGAVAGAAIGFFGGGEQARMWWLKQGQPRLYNDMDAYEQGSMDYLSAYMDMEQLDTQAKHTLKGMGFEGARYYSDTVEGQIRDEITKLSREQKAGRSASTFSAAQYATGTDYVPGTGMAVLHEGERVVPSDQNERITRAIENPPTMAPAAQAGGDMHIHVHAIDTKSGADFLMDHAEDLRSALSMSYANYGGMADVAV